MREIVYKGRDNTNDFILKASGAAVDLSGVTKMELIFPGVTEPVSSDSAPGVFDWSQGGGKLMVSMGHISAIVIGQSYKARLVVYDADTPAGIFWGTITVVVKG
jgi:hypothetical protein